MNHPRITFIGGGNMAKALLAGLLENDYPADNFHVIDPNEKSRKTLQQDYGVHVHASASKVAFACDYVFFAVKPQNMQAVCKEYSAHLKESGCMIISIAAGIRSSAILNWLSADSPKQLNIIRAMPNTPAMVGHSATGLFSPSNLSNEKKLAIEAIFSAIGIYTWLDDEAQMDTVTALSGSGPAYIFYLLECLIGAGIKEGLSTEQAEKLVLQTVSGSIKMASIARQTGEESYLKNLRNRVTSKGGTTEAGLNCLYSESFENTLTNAIQAAKKRSIELSDQMNN